MWTVPDGMSVNIHCTPVVIPLHDNQGDILYATYLDPKWCNRLVSASSVS